MTIVETRLRDALSAAGTQVVPSPDLFERSAASVAADRVRRAERRRAVITGTGVVALFVAAGAAASYRNGRFVMDWWVFEILVTAALVALLLWLGPFIKRFGRGYAADVFRSNPGTGKSFIVLTDFAYYLIFGAYILLTTRVDPPADWGDTVSAGQVASAVARTGGFALVMGLLHGLNLLILPVIGRLLTLNRRLDQELRDAERGSAA